MAIVCSNCRLSIPDENAKFCPYCNAQLSGLITPAANPNDELVKCPKCHGSGFANEPTTARRRFSVGRRCTLCFSAGVVMRETMTEYRRGQRRVWMITLTFFFTILVIASIIYANAHP